MIECLSDLKKSQAVVMLQDSLVIRQVNNISDLYLVAWITHVPLQLEAGELSVGVSTPPLPRIALPVVRP